MAAAEYFRHKSPAHGVQYFRIGGIQATEADCERNRVEHDRKTEIVRGPTEAL